MKILLYAKINIMSSLAREDLPAPCQQSFSAYASKPMDYANSGGGLHSLVSALRLFFTKSLPTLQLLYDVLTMHSSTEISQSMNDNFTSQCF
jgi:hypothetical protein